MILGRFTQHIREQNWFAVGLDVIVVITGILLALAIEDMMQERKNRVSEREYLELLVRDMDLMAETIEAQMEFAEETLALAARTDEMILNGITDENRAELGGLLNVLGMRRTLTLRSAAYEDLKSAGKLHLIQDQNLRDEIMAYFFYVDRAQLIIEKNNNVFVDQSFNRYMEDLGLSYYPSDPDLMENPSAESRTLFVELLEKFPKTMQNPDDAILRKPSGDPIWAKIRQRLSSRAMQAINTGRFAGQMAEATAALKANIEAHLVEIAR